MTNHIFIQEIEEICLAKGIEYIDAVLYWCEKNNLEVETAAYWIKKDHSMKQKIQSEAQNLKILKKDVRISLE